jgi:DNA-binding GntR family transcriptional regulator
MEGSEAAVSPRATEWGAYKSIAESLRTRITDGEFAPGTLLPPESALCAEYRVARNTMRRALDQLAGDGLIVVRPGQGRVVVSPGDATTRATPRYRTMAADLRAQVESGELQPGDTLPSESALAARYGVARGTARQALAELEGAGLVESVHGKGRFVRHR